MPDPCVSCGKPTSSGTCAACGAAQPAAPFDPLIGKVIAERYEITELLSVGGMARIYRAIQRSLERTVVVKVIDPALLTADDITAEEAISRFMVEAQAASRLNHPNVVSIFDFGRTAPGDGGYLFLVMEFLAGSDLWAVLQHEPPLPFIRIASILRQTLAALGEAHYLGITHRDVKPENIIVEERRHGDHVKVIDFGLAKLTSMQSVTQAGKTVGTPHYMAPEQVQGSALGSADLYAIGVILFEMLTGVVPFDGNAPVEILLKHLTAPRPDPRVVAPQRKIPPALAEVCMRAMRADPAERYEDAEALAKAIDDAVGGDVGLSVTSLAPPPMHGAPEVKPDRFREILLEDTADGSPVPGPPLVGRSEELAWASAALGDAAVIGIAWTGRTGIGRTRMLLETAASVERTGALVVRAHALPGPRREIGFGVLRRLVSRLAALSMDDATLASGVAAKEPLAATGLRAIYGGVAIQGKDGPEETRRAAGVALRWAIERALERSKGKLLLVAIDDLDRTDRASRAVLLDVVAKAALGRWKIVLTSEEPITELSEPRVRTRDLAGLSQAQASSLRDALGGESIPVPSQRRDVAIEPLHVTLTHRFGLDVGAARVPARLVDLVEWRVLKLLPAQRRVLQAVALTGGGDIGLVTRVVRDRDLDQALDPLIEMGLLDVDVEEGVSLVHDLFGRIALALAPSGAVAEVHARAADVLVDRPDAIEQRAYHAILGRPDFEAYMLIEDAAALRSTLGDHEGAIAVLGEGVRAGRVMLARGEVEAGQSACLVFSQKLGAALALIGRLDEAMSALKDSLALAVPRDRARAQVLEALVDVARKKGNVGEADGYAREAREITRRLSIRVAPIER